MTKEELGKLYPIEVVEHNPSWPKYYQYESEHLSKLLGKVILDIKHIGSTAVPNMSSKSIIDVLIIIEHENFFDQELIALLKENDYIFMEEQKNHMMFVKGYREDGLDSIAYHIHMGTEDQTFLKNRVYFKDYLIDNTQAFEEYERLKIELAHQYKYDREAYTEMKSDFVKKTTEAAIKYYTNNED